VLGQVCGKLARDFLASEGLFRATLEESIHGMYAWIVPDATEDPELFETLTDAARAEEAGEVPEGATLFEVQVPEPRVRRSAARAFARAALGGEVVSAYETDFAAALEEFLSEWVAANEFAVATLEPAE